MNYHMYPTNKNKLRLRRSRKKIFLVPLGLLGLILILGMFSIYKKNIMHNIQASINIPKSGSSDVAFEIEEDLQEVTRQIIFNDLASWQNENRNFTDLNLNQNKVKPEVSEKRNIKVSEHVLSSGDTLSSILSECLTKPEIYVLCRQSHDVYPLEKLRSGHKYRLIFENDLLTGFEYDIDNKKKLCVEIHDGNFEITKKDIRYKVDKKLVHGNIQSNLFNAVESLGESAELAIRLAEIFAWDVDFIREVREGDSFKLIVEKRYRKGEFAGYGDILAAQFTNKGQTFQAFLYEQDKGRCEYYTAQGQAVRKTFLKAPLNFTRISSGYSLHRRHPILNVVRPHRGIDYAAPSGTPIKSVADGVVIKRTYDKHAGNYVKIRHRNGYITIYNHMTRFASGIGRGVEVKQGDVIGYVGSTGLATGPHLDYRVKKNGEYINPLKIKSKPVEPLPKEELPRFKEKIQPRIAVLEKEKPLYAAKEQSSAESRKLQ